jgi:hypothetical protein
MLPGFRFLFATVVLSVSVLVFGLGAAALLRAAHEEFVSLPSWRLSQQPLLAPQFEMSGPTLAMLRMEAPAPKSLVESTRPQAPYLNALIPDAPRPEPARRDAVRFQPETGPVETAPANDAIAPKDEAATLQAGQSPPAATPPAEAVANLNAQASIDAPAADTPAGEARSETVAAESNSSEASPAEANAETNSAAAKPADSRPPESKQAAAKPPETEASEPMSPEAISVLVRSSEATAADTLPKSSVKKATRPSTRAITRRRLALARARAEARAKAAEQLRQQNAFPLFGG